MPGPTGEHRGSAATPRGYVRSPLAWAVGAALLFVASMLLPPWNFFSSPTEYVALHTVLEFAAMAVGVMVFALSWNLRRIDQNSEIVLLGCFSLAIVLIDLAHMLSYPGMPDLVTSSSADKSITFWLPGRMLAALALLVIAIMPVRRWPQRAWLAGVGGAVVVAVTVWWIGLYNREWLPVFFVPGEGLTSVKVTTEYAIAATYGVAALLLLRRARPRQSVDFAWLACAAWVLMLGELLFTLYANVTDVFNLLGHIFKVIAYLMIYRAIFVAGVQTPYRRLEQETSLLRSLIDSVPDLISFTDAQGRYAGANRAFTRRLGVSEESVVGQTPDAVAHRLNVTAQTAGSAERFEEVIVDADGASSLFDTMRTPYTDQDGRPLGVIEVSRDITAYREAERQVERLALSDPLTGLPNRASLRRSVESRLGDRDRRPDHLTLVLFQLNDFATVNDTVGHEGGDAILTETARRLTGIAPAHSLVARVGGDEFSILLPEQSAEVAAGWVTLLLEEMSEPFQVGEEEFLTTCAVGVATYPEHADDFEGLYRAADTAMYRATVEAANSCRTYSTDMRHESAVRLQLLAGLRSAVAGDQLRLHYQPQVSLSDGRVVAVEALVRWQHPSLGMLPPHAFIELAEESGLILPIGQWVIRTAIRDMQHWDASGLPPVRVAVNISAVQFRQPDLAGTIQGILTETGFPADRLELELTESVAMRNPEQAEGTISRLNDIGVQVAIDDFGTGYSSMAYLRRFRIGKVKIDRSFVANLGHERDEEAIVTAIVDMAAALRCTAIAEGVETIEQVAFLSSVGCAEIQGYLISRPVPRDELTPLLRGPSVLPEALPG